MHRTHWLVRRTTRTVLRRRPPRPRRITRVALRRQHCLHLRQSRTSKRWTLRRAPRISCARLKIRCVTKLSLTRTRLSRTTAALDGRSTERSCTCRRCASARVVGYFIFVGSHQQVRSNVQRRGRVRTATCGPERANLTFLTNRWSVAPVDIYRVMVITICCPLILIVRDTYRIHVGDDLASLCGCASAAGTCSVPALRANVCNGASMVGSQTECVRGRRAP